MPALKFSPKAFTIVRLITSSARTGSFYITEDWLPSFLIKSYCHGLLMNAWIKYHLHNPTAASEECFSFNDEKKVVAGKV